MPKKSSKKKTPVKEPVKTEPEADKGTLTKSSPIQEPAQPVPPPLKVPVEDESMLSPVSNIDDEPYEPVYGELEDMLVVCSQCGHAVRVPPGELLPESCVCGIVFDYANEVPATEVEVGNTTLVVRKVPKKFVR